MVGGVLEANKRWDIGREVIHCISKDFPGALPIRPKVSSLHYFCISPGKVFGAGLGIELTELLDNTATSSSLVYVFKYNEASTSENIRVVNSK